LQSESYLWGSQQQVNVQVEQAIVNDQQTETPRLAKAMPRKASTMTQDETFTGGLCLVASSRAGGAQNASDP
jgi:hypothetical protein